MKKIFMIMPFEDVYFEVFEMLKMEFSDSFSFSNAGEEGNPQNILNDIITPIYEADYIIADLTGLNPNVMYELGIAHSFRKKTIMITQDDLATLPFDLKQYRTKCYNTYFKKFNELITYLKSVLYGDYSYGNPVMDFLDLKQLKTYQFETNEQQICDLNEEENGFLDYMSEIESNLECLNKNVQELNSDMNRMTEGIQDGTKNINDAKKEGKTGTAIIRNEIKKIAGYIEEFDLSLREKTKALNGFWDRIEIATLNLIDNPFARNEGSNNELRNFIDALLQVKNGCVISIPKTRALKEVLAANYGLEKSMNHAIGFLKDDLSSYILFMERMCNSIDRIHVKARIILEGNK